MENSRVSYSFERRNGRKIIATDNCYILWTSAIRLRLKASCVLFYCYWNFDEPDALIPFPLDLCFFQDFLNIFPTIFLFVCGVISHISTGAEANELNFWCKISMTFHWHLFLLDTTFIFDIMCYIMLVLKSLKIILLSLIYSEL